MNKSFIALAVLPIALLSMGCKSVCEKAASAKYQLGVLAETVEYASASHTLLDRACKADFKKWDKKLGDQVKLAEKAASKLFYSEERYCISGRYHDVCGWEHGQTTPPYGNDRNWECRSVYVCDKVKVIPQYKEGYNDAKELAEFLRAVRKDLKDSCASHRAGRTNEALLRLEDTNARIVRVRDTLDVMMTKGGCDL